MSNEEAMALIDRLAQLPVLPVTFPMFRNAALLQRRYQISYWDAAILAAAKESWILFPSVVPCQLRIAARVCASPSVSASK
jgi:hypothetical protein